MKSMISHTQRVQKIVFFKLTSRYSKGCEGAVASSESLRPTLSSVLYLGDVGGPTMILNQVGRLKGGRTWDIAVLVGLSDSGACGWRLVCSSTTEATLLREPAWPSFFLQCRTEVGPSRHDGALVQTETHRQVYGW